MMLNRNEALSVLESITGMYPRFELTEQVIEAWLPLLEEMDYKRVMARLRNHAVSNRFPPTIAEISAYAPPENTALKKMEKWQREAEQVPDEVKQKFQQKMKQLIQEKSG